MSLRQAAVLVCFLSTAFSLASTASAQLVVARHWRINEKDLSGKAKFSLGDDLNIRIYNDDSRTNSSNPAINEGVIRMRFDARVGQTRVLWGGPQTMTVYGTAFNQFEKPKPRAGEEAEMQFAEPNSGPDRGKLKNGAAWGFNTVLISDSGNHSLATKPCAFVFELIDGDGDKKFNSDSDQVILHGIAYDPSHLAGKDEKNLATSKSAVRTAFRIRLPR